MDTSGARDLQAVEMGTSQNLGYIITGPYNKDYSILGFILESPYLGKLPNTSVVLAFRLPMFQLFVSQGVLMWLQLHASLSCPAVLCRWWCYCLAVAAVWVPQSLCACGMMIAKVMLTP